MGFSKILQKRAISVCNKIGEANLPVYTVAAVAVFKGILRPAFTMMDKKSDPETKKYAAIREGATELVAFPTYIAMSWLTEKFAPAFSPNGKTMDQLLHSSKSTLGFLGVCFAAVYAIPKLCNVVMPHLMKALKMEKSGEKKEAVLNTFSQERWDVFQNTKPVVSLYGKPPVSMSGGMKI